MLISRSRRRGSSVVEFSLISPVLLMIFMGLVDYCWFLARSTEVQHAAREGVRLAASLPQDGSPGAAAEARALAVLDEMGFDCASGCSATATTITGASGSRVQLALNVPAQAMIGLVPTPAEHRARLSMLFEDQF